MQTSVTFVDCPAYAGQDGTARCGLPAEVECLYTVQSTDGPLESARIRCPRGHQFNGLVQSLTPGHSGQPAGTSAPSQPAMRLSRPPDDRFRDDR